MNRRRFLRTLGAGAAVAPQLPGILARATTPAPIFCAIDEAYVPLPVAMHDFCGCSIISPYREYVSYSSFKELAAAIPAGRDIILSWENAKATALVVNRKLLDRNLLLLDQIIASDRESLEKR